MKKTVSLFGAGRVVLAVLVLGLAACASNVPAPVVGWNDAAAQTDGPTYTVKSGDTLYSIARAHNMDFRELVALNGIENPDQISVGRALRIGPRADAPAPVAVAAPVTSDVVVVRPIGSASAAGRQPAGEDNTAQLKREPKAGKEPYSEQALAMAQSEGQQPKPGVSVTESPVASVAEKPAASVAEKPAASVAEKPAAAVAASSKGPWIWPSGGKVIATFSESSGKGIDIAGKAGDPVVAAGDGRIVYSGTGLRGYGKLVIIKHNATFLSAYAHNRNILVKEGQSVTQGQKIAEMGNTDADRVKLHFEVRRQGKPVDPLQYLPRR
jgi:lipoprotein NlpD